MKLQRLPVEVDPFRMVEQGRKLQGRIPFGDFPRLSELLHESSVSLVDDDAAQVRDDSDVAAGVVEVMLEFKRSDTGLPMVTGTVKCQLPLSCQRCLEPVTKQIDSRLAVVFVTSDVRAVELQQGYDTWLVEDNRLIIRDFIEDEILLALPLVVVHDDCQPVRELQEFLPHEQADKDTEKDNPFAVLKNLKLEK